MIAFMYLNHQLVHHVPRVHQNHPKLWRVPGKTLFASSEVCLHPFRILKYILTSGETILGTHQTTSLIPVTCYKRFPSRTWWSVREPDFSCVFKAKALHLMERRPCGAS